MKKIRIKICKYNDKEGDISEHFIYKILRKYYDIEISETPDYVFCHESSFEHLKYSNSIKIFYTGENISPNFNLYDYAIGFDYMDFGDRYYRLPLYLTTVFYNQDELRLAGDDYLTRQEPLTKQDLLDKTDFCSFVYSNYRAGEERKIFFDKLNNYKKVNAGGGYLNNIGGKVDNKLGFEMKHKFSIAFENSSRAGYTTEKIVSSLVAKTIPIYWGNPEIAKEFNERRFINCHRYNSFDEAVKYVKEIDNNDDLYLSIINEPIAAKGYDFEKVKKGSEDFLRHIIDQPLNLAKRRTINPTRAKNLIKYEMITAKYVRRHNQIIKILSELYQPFKKIKMLEKFKHQYFKK